MRRLFVLVLMLSLSGVTSALAAGAQSPVLGSISGVASTASGQANANAKVQLRNLANGELVSNTTSNAAGQFSFVGVNSGTYAVEVISAAGQIVGSSAAIALALGAVVTDVAVKAPAVGAASGSTTAHKPFFASAAGLVTAAAAAAAVAGVTVAAGKDTASPSR